MQKKRAEKVRKVQGRIYHAIMQEQFRWKRKDPNKGNVQSKGKRFER